MTDTELSADLEEAKAEAPRAIGSLISLGEVFPREEEQALLSKIEKRLAAIFPPGTLRTTQVYALVLWLTKKMNMCLRVTDIHPEGPRGPKLRVIAIYPESLHAFTGDPRFQRDELKKSTSAHTRAIVFLHEKSNKPTWSPSKGKDKKGTSTQKSAIIIPVAEAPNLAQGFLYKIGIVSKEQPVIVQKGDLTSKWVGHSSEVTRKKILISQFVGHTSEVTRKKINASKGGVLLVDEAYRLAQANSSSKDVGREALEELMSVMESGDPMGAWLWVYGKAKYFTTPKGKQLKLRRVLYENKSEKTL
uniref:Uncharacterized protein n=1 Tax=Branchiostoma floridae TaxID=7739 RepID=C3ZAZ7_BRAFL|eukprot:XP_002594023.1 hypothetical protein BRAFLDRAFT_68537 [Branchiostoma floridae]